MFEKVMTNKRKLVSVIVILTVIAVINTISTVLANPPLYERGFKPPDASTKPSEITVFSPTNGTTYENNTLILSVNVTLPDSSTASGTILYYVAFTSDWNENETVLYNNKGYVNTIESQFPDPQRHYFTGLFELTNIPYGEHNLTITAIAGGFYPDGIDGFYRFRINGTSTIFFTVGNSVTPTSSFPIDRNSLHLELIDYLLPIIVILAVVIVLFVLLFGRDRKTASLSK
jgi:hypothetical protein